METNKKIILIVLGAFIILLRGLIYIDESERNSDPIDSETYINNETMVELNESNITNTNLRIDANTGSVIIIEYEEYYFNGVMPE